MTLRALYSVLAILVGIFFVVYGGYDDSPGGQGIGLLLIIFGTVRLTRLPMVGNGFIGYLKDNPNGYWFRARWYGWGWVPARWQGWAVLAGWLIAVIALSLTIDEQSPPREVMFTFFLPLLLLTVTLFRICWKKGERPRWNWGDPRKRT